GIAPGRGGGGGHRRRPRRRWLWWLLLVAVLAGGGWAAWTYVIPHSARVPSVLGAQLDDGRSRLEGSGFHVRMGRAIASIRYPAGEIASEDPPPGTHLRKGSVVVLEVSSGPPLRAVPSVQGLPVATAQSQLLGRGFKTKVI